MTSWRAVACDIGAAEVARRLADALDAFLIMTNYSRLAIDCNRPPGSADLFHPYHDRIRAELDARRGRKQPAVRLALHSFTPGQKGRPTGPSGLRRCSRLRL